MTSSQSGTDETAVNLPGAAVVTALVDPLLDARIAPAADEFDRLICAAVAAGAIGEELARELRFWQRASVHELADHVRTVLPLVLPVALTAVTAAAADALASAAAAEAAWRAKDDTVPVSNDYPDADPQPEVVVSAADGIALNTPPPGDDTDSAPAASSPHLRRRLFVAGLTSTA